MALDRGGPALALQVLVYPVTHHAFDTPSHRAYGHGYLPRSKACSGTGTTLGQVFDDGRASVAYAGAALQRALA